MTRGIRRLLCRKGEPAAEADELLLYLHAVGAVGDTGSREVGDLEDGLGGDTGSDGEESGSELHLGGWSWWWKSDDETRVDLEDMSGIVCSGGLMRATSKGDI